MAVGDNAGARKTKQRVRALVRTFLVERMCQYPATQLDPKSLALALVQVFTQGSITQWPDSLKM